MSYFIDFRRILTQLPHSMEREQWPLKLKQEILKSRAPCEEESRPVVTLWRRLIKSGEKMNLNSNFTPAVYQGTSQYPTALPHLFITITSAFHIGLARLFGERKKEGGAYAFL